MTRRPHGENERYGFVVDSGKRFWRVQVKSSYCIYRGAYRARCHRASAKLYKADEIDFVVAYVVPLSIWYVIPANCVIGSVWVAFYPSGCQQGGRFECYREAWHLMAGHASPSAKQGTTK